MKTTTMNTDLKLNIISWKFTALVETLLKDNIAVPSCVHAILNKVRDRSLTDEELITSTYNSLEDRSMYVFKRINNLGCYRYELLFLLSVQARKTKIDADVQARLDEILALVPVTKKQGLICEVKLLAAIREMVPNQMLLAKDAIEGGHVRAPQGRVSIRVNHLIKLAKDLSDEGRIKLFELLELQDRALTELIALMSDKSVTINYLQQLRRLAVWKPRTEAEIDDLLLSSPVSFTA